MDDLVPVFVLAVIFGAIVAIVYLSIRKKERMAMLEKGVDASVFFTTVKRNSYSLKYGLLLIGVALGILIGNILATTEAFMYEEEAAYFSMIFLFGGLALVIYYFMAKKMSKDEEDNDPLIKKE
jgi:ABC-type Fe3+-siderophore transport system permease subunit